MRNNGLLERASALRKRPRSSSRPPSLLADAKRLEHKPDEVDRDLEDGITADDREEILAEIDGLSRGNRISVGGDLMVLSPRRKSYLFPLAINVAAAVLTAGGLVGLSILSSQRQTRFKSGQALVATAEGKLIQEIKLESESKLQEKDKAIADIRTRLGAIDKQRLDLAAGLEDRIKAKQEEFKVALPEAIAKERQRLTALGLSGGDSARRLRKFEADKNAEFGRELAAFRAQADAQKATTDAELARLRDEYQKNVASLGDERKKILDDEGRREQDLRASLESKTKALESQSAESKASLDKAKAELASVRDLRDRAQAAEDRILGLYGTIRTALRDRRFAEAADGSTALVAYLNDPSVLAEPSLQKRREADLFIADTLGSLARDEVARASVDSGLLLKQAELLAAARSAVAAADKALRAGDPAAAAADYDRALAAIPEILAAHSYFIDKARDEEAARVGRLAGALSAADLSYRSGDLTAAYAKYTEALAYMPIDDRARSEIAQRLAQVGAADVDKSKRLADTKAARGQLDSARRDYAAGRWQEAIAGYLVILAAYPAADQAPEAAKGIDLARAGLVAQADARAAADAASIAALKSSTDASVAALKSQASSLQGKYETAAARADQLQKELDAARSETATAAGKAASTSAAAASAAQAGDLVALRQENERLKAVESAYDDDLGAYSAYAKAEDSDRSVAGPGAALAAKASLSAFLNDPAIGRTFPGMGDRVGRLLLDYQNDLPTETLLGAADIAIEAARLKTVKERQDYLDDQSSRYATANPRLRDFIERYKTILGQ